MQDLPYDFSCCLAQVEAQLKTNSLIDNLCVYADAKKTHTVALVVPLKGPLEEFASKISPGYSNMDWPQTCKDQQLAEVRGKAVKV